MMTPGPMPPDRPARAPRAIRTRILAAFLISIGMFTGALIYTLVQLSNIGEQLQLVSQTYQPVSSVSTQLKALTRRINREHLRITTEEIEPEPGHLHRAQLFSGELQDTVTQGQNILSEAQPWVRDRAEREAIALMKQELLEIGEDSERYHELHQVWYESSPEDRDQAFKAMDEQREQLSLQIGRHSERVGKRITGIGASTSSSQERAYTIAGALVLSAILIGTLLAGVALFTLKPIGELTRQVQRLAAGDYTGRVDVGGKDEMGVLAQEINAMAAAVQERDRILVERAEALDQLSLRLRRILDTINAGLVVIHGRRAETVNPAATDLWGLTEGDELPEPLVDLDVGTHRSTAFGERVFDLAIVPFGGDGRLLVGEDVTERIAAQDRLARTERLALVGRMLAQITHEVRNPLNAMSLNAELLAEDLADSPHHELVETITREIRRLDQLTGRYLEMSRGRRSELNPVDPLELVKDVLLAEGQALQQAGVETVLQGVSPGVVEVDTDALRRALLNILRNASEAGATRVELALRTLQGEKSSTDRLVLQIQDNGPGIEPTQVKRVFEPFFTTKAGGTGLGLAISRQELEDVGGSLVANSEPDQGSRFVLEIPFRQG